MKPVLVETWNVEPLETTDCTDYTDFVTSIDSRS